MGNIHKAIEKMTLAIDMRPDWPLYLCNRGK
jgi:hypothetical protein